MTDTPPDTTMLRAIANALWGKLRRNRWQTHTVTRDLSKYNPSGYQAGPRSSTVATAPSMNAVVELHHECFITAVLYGEDWPGKTSHALRLDRDAHDQALSEGRGAMIDDWEAGITYSMSNAEYALALTRSTCRTPFHQQANRHGVMGLRRNAADEFITPTVAAVLERIAAATQFLPITEATIDDFLITDDDIDLQALEKVLGSPYA